MKVTSTESRKTVTLELDSVDIEGFKDAWHTLERYRNRKFNSLGTSEHKAIELALTLMGAVI